MNCPLLVTRYRSRLPHNGQGRSPRAGSSPCSSLIHFSNGRIFCSNSSFISRSSRLLVDDDSGRWLEDCVRRRLAGLLTVRPPFRLGRLRGREASLLMVRRVRASARSNVELLVNFFPVPLKLPVSFVSFVRRTISFVRVSPPSSAYPLQPLECQRPHHKPCLLSARRYSLDHSDCRNG
jgi:hypothetical protein